MNFKEEDLSDDSLDMQHPAPHFYTAHRKFTLAMITDIFSLNYLTFSIEKECGVPNIEPNVIAEPRKDKYKVGDVLKFSCRRRLKIVGTDSVQCYHFGWSPSPPTCKGEYLRVAETRIRI